ncbi:MAG: hypothetical protein GY769_09590 [bacterium]|nr:hypothetical protein [bacterium]
MKKPLSMMVLAVLTVGDAPSPGVLRAEENPAEGSTAAELVDRIVAVVDEDPILASDLERAIGLGLVSQLEDEAEDAFRRRVLDLMLEERLRAHEVDRFGFTEISLAEVERAVESLESAFASARAFEERLAELGLSTDDVRQIVARQVMVLTYVDERLGPRVFVSLDDIREYYDSVLTPEMKRTGQKLPELNQVREEIRSVLREQRLNQEIERWTAELRLEADIEDYFERPAAASADVVIGVRTASE